MASFDFRKYTHHLIVIAAMLVIALLYCYPALSGKKLAQSDSINWRGMSEEARKEQAKTDETVLWSNSMFGGMPTYTYFVDKSNNFINVIQAGIESVLPSPVFFFFIAMICFYILMQVLGVNHWLAGIGAVAFAFSTYNPVIISVGHNTKMLTMAYMPAVIAGMLLLYRGRWLGGAALFGISMALMVQNLHFQVIYYCIILLFFMVLGLLYVAVKEGHVQRFFMASAVAGVVGLIAIGPSMPGFLPTQEYSKMTMRGGASEVTFINHDSKKTGGLDKDYAFRWSNGIGETFCLLVPDLYGGSSSEPADRAPETSEITGGRAERLPLYWGPQPVLSGPVYFGAVICFLFVLGLFVVKSPHKWWIIAVSALCIIMSWGNHFAAFNYFLFDHLPMLNKFRTPSMILVVPELLFPMLGIWALNDIITGKTDTDTAWKSVRIAAIITGGLALLLGVAGSAFFNFSGPGDAQFQNSFQDPGQLAAFLKALKSDRASLAMKSGIESAVYIAVAAGLLWAFIKGKLKAMPVIAGIGIIIVIDLLPVAYRYLNANNYEEADAYTENFEPRAVDKQIMADPDPYYRVLDLSRDTYNDAIQAYFHKCVGGYSPAKMEIYQDLIDVHLGQGGFNSQVLNMLNTKYFIVGGQGHEPNAIPNPDAAGNAWFVSNIKWVNSADDEIRSLNAPKLGDTAKAPAGTFKPKETAVIRNTYQSSLAGFTPGKDSSANIKLAKYGLDEISFTANNSKEGLAVFSDIWYPYGWKAFIDGKETPIIRTDYVLRALRVPAGVHKIEFRFHPDSYYTGNTIALICSILLWALIIAAIVMVFRNKNDAPAQSQAV